MPDRWWVGVDQNWFDTNNWSAVSGGVGGAGVPTSIDDVFLDGNGFVLCWSTAPIACRNLTLLAAMTELLILDQGGVINGDFVEQGGYFGPTGGGGWTVEFKGDWLKTGGTFAVGTGTGIDPTCEFSGIGRTYQLNDPSAATYQNFLVSGSYTFSGTRLSVAWISQELRISGTMTIASGNRIDLDGSFESLTGTMDGDGALYYYYETGESMPVGGIVNCQFFRFIIGSSLVELIARTWESNCTVEIEYMADGQVFRMGGGSRHYFMGNLKIYCDEVTANVAEMDLDTNTAQMWIEGNFTTDTAAFPNATWTLRLGDGTHVFRAMVSFFFSYASATAHLVVDPGDGTIILWQAPSGGGLIIFIQHRLSRVYSGGQDYQTYNRVILFTEAFNSRPVQFIEGWGAIECLIESYGATWNFRRQTLAPQMLYEWDRVQVIGSETSMPQLRAQRSLTPAPWGLQVVENKGVFSCNIRYADASWGIGIDAYNSGDLSNNTDIEFYDRDVRSINRQRNMLSDRAILTPTPAPEPFTEPLLEGVL